jgi:glycosyltransferase involved in cell wall biosynthesis
MNTIIILGTAYPYRGGLASFNEMLARTFQKKGKQVKVNTFTVQYPNFLFPGKTQFSESAAPEDIDIERCVNSVNPFNWFRTGLRIRRERPDMVLVKYWTPFLAPCLGTICYLAKSNRHTRIISQLDNVVPHEAHFFDSWLTRYFIGAADGFVYMSQQVKQDLDKFTVSKPALFSPHPVFANFGERVGRDEALKHLHLSEQTNYLLFFGIIRDYKGLDLLIDAWKILKDKGLSEGRKVIVAGEYYNNKEQYTSQIQRLGLEDEILVHDFFIRDDEVKYYFSAVDVVVQPYKDATQSGVTQIAYQFSIPMIVTAVGGLAEIVPDGRSGFVTDANAESIAEAIEKFYACGGAPHFAETIAEERKRFTWEAMTEQMERLVSSNPVPEGK